MTKSAMHLKVFASVLLAIAGSASAATYTNVPNGANTGSPFAYFGNAANPSGDSPKVGEVFSLSSAATLSSFDFYAIGTTTASLQLNVAQWIGGTGTGSGPYSVGTPLLTTTGSAVETYNSTGGITTLDFSNLNLGLNANTKYIAYLTSSDPTVTGIQLSRTQTSQDASGFGLGNGYLSTTPGNGWQLPFSGSGFLSLQYTAITAAAVPEPESLAMLLAGMGLIGAAVARRKVKQA
jgi:hypothetical protein